MSAQHGRVDDENACVCERDEGEIGEKKLHGQDEIDNATQPDVGGSQRRGQVKQRVVEEHAQIAPEREQAQDEEDRARGDLVLLGAHEYVLESRGERDELEGENAGRVEREYVEFDADEFETRAVDERVRGRVQQDDRDEQSDDGEGRGEHVKVRDEYGL